ncbi:hypothetical protein LCGC14_1813140, partial [marine sediment metagenome]
SIAPDFDGYDPYGSVMQIWFECADRLHSREEDVPDEWEYVPGYSLNELDELYTEYDNSYLLMLGNAAMELSGLCKKLELSY